MIVILAYDINTTDKSGEKRLRKILKISRRYLFQVQKSVFKGELSYAKLNKLKKEIYEVIDRRKDKVVIYIFDSYPGITNFDENQIGTFEAYSNII